MCIELWVKWLDLVVWDFFVTLQNIAKMCFASVKLNKFSFVFGLLHFCSRKILSIKV